MRFNTQYIIINRPVHCGNIIMWSGSVVSTPWIGLLAVINLNPKR